MVAGILVMFMQAGFSMLESGTVQSKNAQSILMKNLLDACVGAICWWAVGYGVAFGEDKGGNDDGTKGGIIGGNLFFGQNKDYQLADGNFHYLSWFFQWAFCATAATIVSGAVAERVKLSGYAIFMVVMTAFIYPVVVHWTWGGGFLTNQPEDDAGLYNDFAGSGIVHMTGGVAALLGAAIIGPRTGRFDPDKAEQFNPHNVPMVVLGTFILWFGWYGFNCGSTVSMTGDAANTAALVAMTTTLSAATGGLTVFYIRLAVTKKYDLCGLANGILAGLVSITAPCAGVYGWAAIVIGFIGGLIFIGASALLKMVKIDDPLDAFAVHGACGAWGTLAVAFFDFTVGIFYSGSDGHAGMAGKQLGWQLAGIITIAVWTAGLSGITFFALRMAGLLRITAEDEEEGADKHFTTTSPPVSPGTAPKGNQFEA
jgi:Amt family ammonium transporter